MQEVGHSSKERILILAPLGHDAEALCEYLLKAGHYCGACIDVQDLCDQIRNCPGAVLLTEEVLSSPERELLTDALDAQPHWSDVPVILLSGGSCWPDRNGAIERLMGSGRYVTVLHRPVRHESLLTAVRSALRARDRQYQVEHLLGELEETNRELQERVDERTAELQAMNRALSREIDERQKSDEALHSILNHSPTIIYMKDLDSRYLFINEKCESVLGIKNEEIVGKTPHEVFPRDLADQFIQNDKKVIESLAPSEVEETIPQPDGAHTVLSVQFPLFDVSGKPHAICGISTDITQRKRMEEALRESTERFRLFMDNNPAVAWMKDEDGRYVYLSTPCLNRFGIKIEEWLGKTDFDHWPADVAREFRENDLAVLRSGKVMEVVEKNYASDRAPSYWWTFKFPFEDSSGKRYVGGVGLDITEREQMAEELRKREDLFHKAFDLAPVGMTLLDLNGRFQRANQAFCRITGYSEEELLKTDFKQLTLPEDLEYNLVQFDRLLAGEIPVFFLEKRYRHKNGSIIWVRASANVRRDPEGRPFQFVGIVEDITERVHVAQELRKAHEELEIRVKKRTSELKEKTERLEELNTALKVLVKQREEDRKEQGESILANVRNLITPYIDRLKNSRLDRVQSTLIGILESNIDEIASSFSRTLSVQHTNLTPTEMRIAAFIRDGKSNTEIAEILCISEKTASCHRANIRKKLGLRGGRANLRLQLLNLK